MPDIFGEKERMGDIAKCHSEQGARRRQRRISSVALPLFEVLRDGLYHLLSILSTMFKIIPKGDTAKCHSEATPKNLVVERLTKIRIYHFDG